MKHFIGNYILLATSLLYAPPQGGQGEGQVSAPHPLVNCQERGGGTLGSLNLNLIKYLFS